MKSREQHIDKVLLMFVLALMFIGILLVFSSTVYIANLKYDSATYFLENHILRVLIGFAVMVFFIVFVDYKKLKDWAFYIFVVSLILLVLVLFIGKGTAKRWLVIGPVSVQVSEVAKISLVIYLSYLIEKNAYRLTNFKLAFLPLFSVIVVVSGLILLQKSFTMAFIVFSVGMILMFLGGARVGHLAVGLGLGFAVSILMLIIEPYRFQRLMAYLGFGNVGQGVKHQAVQSLIGLGNGGLFGVGLGHSKQRELYLPLAYDDYIFSIFGEEYGFIGSLVLIFIFFVIFYRGIKIAKHTPDEFGKILASGVTFVIFLTAVVHIAVVSGILPPTGIPLPFISYGGTAMIVNCASVGILLNISKQIKH